MADTIVQRIALPPSPSPWPTLDPFLFCVHHNDEYPVGNEQMGPASSLAGRQIGQDFAGLNGWSMYHGQTVPGFPQHPHRGFETITYGRRGFIDHADSLGAAARYGEGDVQWMTAGNGIVHSEMFPLLDREGPNPTELFQIWINLPAEDKTVDPHFAMLWDRDIPKLTVEGDSGDTTITVIAGSLDGHDAPSPPPNSWASRSDSEVAIWHISSGPGASTSLPAATADDVLRTFYIFDGDPLSINGEIVAPGNAAVVRPDADLELVGGTSGSDCLMLQGRPIGEPVAQYGPFVLNDQAGIEKAFRDYQATQFGGWPWDRNDPTHGRGGRFARHGNGHEEQVA